MPSASLEKCASQPWHFKHPKFFYFVPKGPPDDQPPVLSPFMPTSLERLFAIPALLSRVSWLSAGVLAMKRLVTACLAASFLAGVVYFSSVSRLRPEVVYQQRPARL